MAREREGFSTLSAEGEREREERDTERVLRKKKKKKRSFVVVSFSCGLPIEEGESRADDCVFTRAYQQLQFGPNSI